MALMLGELFCGPGGLALGAKLALPPSNRYRIVHGWATDIDENTCETYRRNICPGQPNTVVCADIRKLQFRVLGDISHADVVAFGFPCNDFSVVGEQKGVGGSYGPLYAYGVRALEYFRPKCFVAENVGGLRSADKGQALAMVLQALRNAGYAVFPHYYRFELYGVPQARHRVIIVGFREDLGLKFEIPAPLPDSRRRTSRQALEDPPIPPNASNNELTSQAGVVVERLSYIKPGQNAFTADIPQRLQLQVRGARISQIYRRLDPDKPAYTVTGSGGGGTHVYHWAEPRALTNRERARLQTFPDSFHFVGGKESVRRQIGMAVPVLGAKVIFEAIQKSLAGKSYDLIESNLAHLLV